MRVVFGRGGNTPPDARSTYGADAMPVTPFVALSSAVCSPAVSAIVHDPSGTTGALVNVLIPATVSSPVVWTAPVLDALSIAACRPAVFAMVNDPSGTTGGLLNVFAPAIVSAPVLCTTAVSVALPATVVDSDATVPPSAAVPVVVPMTATPSAARAAAASASFSRAFPNVDASVNTELTGAGIPPPVITSASSCACSAAIATCHSGVLVTAASVSGLTSVRSST